MKFVDFPERTNILAENQPEYQQIPVHCEIRHEDITPPQPNVILMGEPAPQPEIVTRPYVHAMTCCIQFTPEQLAEMAANDGKFWYRQMLFGNLFQPIFMSTKNPFDPQNAQYWPEK